MFKKTGHKADGFSIVKSHKFCLFVMFSRRFSLCSVYLKILKHFYLIFLSYSVTDHLEALVM